MSQGGNVRGLRPIEGIIAWGRFIDNKPGN
jgi:hypothetical protein